MPSKDLQTRRETWRRWYYNNSEQAREFYRKKARKRKQRIQKWYREYKSELSCSRCSEDHPVCLDFHHTNPENKVMTPSLMVAQSFSIPRIKKEMSKCIVLCSNCHRKEHYS